MGSSYAVWTRFGLKDGMSKGFGKMGKAASGFGSVLKGILSANLIQAGFRKLKEGMASFITEASKIEDAVAGFTPLMGGVEKATQLVDRLNQEAATTPFQFEGIAGIAKQLLPVMNGSIEDTANTFRMLGDTAGGNIQKLESITRGYTKALLKGKPDMEALNMIAEAGVPIFTEMSKTMGISVAQLTQMSSKGKLTNDQLTKTFQNMTKEGGIFFKGMEIASQTFTGKISTLKDNIALTAGAIGSTFMGVLKDGTDQLINIASGVREWVVANKELIKSKIMGFVNGIKSIVEKLGPSISRLASAVFGFGKTIIDVVSKALAPFSKGMGDSNGMLSTFQFLIDGATNVINFFGAVLQKISPLLTTIGEIIFFVTNKIGEMIGQFSKAMEAKGTMDLLGKSVDSLGRIFNVAFDVIKKVFNFISDIGVIDLLVSAFNRVVSVVNLLANVFSFMWSIVSPILDALMEIVKFLIKPIIDLTSAVNDMGNSIIDNIGGFFGGAADFIGGIGKGIGDFFGGGPKESARGPSAPNQSEIEARQAVQFQGEININGAPPGSTAREIKINNAPQIRYNLIGVNG